MNKNFTALILLVLAFGAYFTFTSGKIQEVKALRASNQQYEDAIAKADQLIKVRDKLRDDYNGISDLDKERLNKMVPNIADNIRLAIDLNNLAFKYGYTLRNISISNPQSADDVIKAKAAEDNSSNTKTVGNGQMVPITISFSVVSPFAKFRSFMTEIESNLRIMDLTSLTMTVNDTGNYDFSVVYKTYWLKK
jgi:Tfp pilus assembly protein PilO